MILLLITNQIMQSEADLILYMNNIDIIYFEHDTSVKHGYDCAFKQSIYSPRCLSLSLSHELIIAIDCECLSCVYLSSLPVFYAGMQ